MSDVCTVPGAINLEANAVEASMAFSCFARMSISSSDVMCSGNCSSMSKWIFI